MDFFIKKVSLTDQFSNIHTSVTAEFQVETNQALNAAKMFETMVSAKEASQKVLRDNVKLINAHVDDILKLRADMEAQITTEQSIIDKIKEFFLPKKVVVSKKTTEVAKD